MDGVRKERRGFASMSPEKQREIASKGGRAAHEKGTAHEWTADEARAAGRKGGQISRGGRGRLVSTATDSGAPASADTGSNSIAAGSDRHWSIHGTARRRSLCAGCCTTGRTPWRLAGQPAHCVAQPLRSLLALDILAP